VSAFLHRRFWIVKLLGVAIGAQFLGSTASAVLGLWLMQTSADETTAAASDDEEDEEDADELADEEPVLAATAVARSDARNVKRDLAKRQLEAYNPFCPNCTESTPAPEPGASPTALLADASPLPLRLNATMEALDPTSSLATIDDLELGIVGVYTTGDQIRPGVVLASVERGRVLVQRGSAIERIELGAPAPAPKPEPKAATTKPAAKKPATTDDRVECTNDMHCVVQRELVEEVFANPAAFASQAPRVVPSPDGGYKLSSIKSGSLVKQLGFKTGDRLLAVNGEELAGMDAMLGMAQKLRRAASVTVTIDRKGKTIDKQIEIKG
jgi:general secretion pathway protein C